MPVQCAGKCNPCRSTCNRAADIEDMDLMDKSPTARDLRESHYAVCVCGKTNPDYPLCTCNSSSSSGPLYIPKDLVSALAGRDSAAPGPSTAGKIRSPSGRWSPAGPASAVVYDDDEDGSRSLHSGEDDGDFEDGDDDVQDQQQQQHSPSPSRSRSSPNSGMAVASPSPSSGALGGPAPSVRENDSRPRIDRTRLVKPPPADGTSSPSLTASPSRSLSFEELGPGPGPGPGLDQSRVKPVDVVALKARTAQQRRLDQVFTAEEVAKHNTIDDCWMIIRGYVYDITDYIGHHPGGTRALLKFAGKDGTENVQFHSKKMMHLLRTYFYMGRLEGTSKYSCVIS